jgi:hypothetical protein
MPVDFKMLTPGERVVCVSGVVLIIATLLPWYGITVAGRSGSNTGWDYFVAGVIPAFIAIAMVTQVVVSRFTDAKVPDPGGVTWGQVHLVLGAVALVLVVLKLLLGSSESIGPFDIDLDRRYGIYIATLAAIGLAFGGFQIARERGELPAALKNWGGKS